MADSPEQKDPKAPVPANTGAPLPASKETPPATLTPAVPAAPAPASTPSAASLTPAPQTTTPAAAPQAVVFSPLPPQPAPIPTTLQAGPAPAPVVVVPPLSSVQAPPVAPVAPVSPKPKEEIDLDKILLTQKGAVSSQSAQRVNAGALFQQEQRAAKEPLAPSTPKPATSAPPTAPAPGTTAPKKPGEETSIKGLQTYRSDIESVVEGKNLSVVSIAAAESDRLARAGVGNDPEAAARVSAERSAARMAILKKVGFVLGGAVLLGATALVTITLMSQPTTVPLPEDPTSPFISVDGTKFVEEPWGALTRVDLMTDLEQARANSALPLGLIERLLVVHPATSTSGAPQAVAAGDVIATLAPNAPLELLRTVEPEFLLGVHSFDGNQSLLIVRVDSYDVGYGAMLAWEISIKDDLTPLFARTPRPRIPEEGSATSTASTTPQFLRTVFIDRVVENRDTRVVENEFGDILLLWTFLDRNTILITTNEYTLREVLSRAKTAPVIPLP